MGWESIMSHRVVAPVTRRPARRAVAVGAAINELFPWATVAGRSLACSACGTEARAPALGTRAEYANAREHLAAIGSYNATALAFLAQHRGCRMGART